MKRFNIFALALMLALMGTVVVQAQNTATPEPTTNMAQATVEPTVEAMQEPAPVLVRFAHWSPDAPAVDVYLNGESAFTNVAYPSLSGYVTLDAGTYTVAVTTAGTSVDQAVLTAEVELNEGAYVTISAVGSAVNGTLSAVVSVDDFSPIPFGSARILAYHTVEGAGNVDLYANDVMVITELGYPGKFTDLNGEMNDGAFAVDIAAGTYDLSVRATVNSAITSDETAVPTTEAPVDATDTVIVPSIVTLPDVVLEAGTIYTVAVIGNADAPTTFTSSMAGVVAPQPTVLDVALGNPNFSILAAAVQAADPSVAAALSAEGNLTVFAPTNAAFDAMLTGMNMTTNDLLTNAELLNAVLLYHVVGSRNDAAAITVLNGQTLPSLQGEPISITVNETGGVVLNGSVNVTSADIAASNGVVHVIDGVLIPPSVANVS